MTRNAVNGKEPEIIDGEMVTPLMDMARKLIEEKEKAQTQLAQRLKSTLVNRVSESRWNSPTGSSIEGGTRGSLAKIPQTSPEARRKKRLRIRPNSSPDSS